MQFLIAQEEPLRFKKIEGLSQNTGYSITKDKQGFLWIATANGLNRYDGMEMKSYKPSFENKSGEMQGRIIRSQLLLDDKERIWFSTDVTVQCFEKRKGTFSIYSLSTSATSGNAVFANPVVMLTDHLWLANAGYGLFDFNTVTKKYVHYPLSLKDEKGNPVQLMYNGIYDNKDRLWFASNKGLLSFNLKQKQWQQYMSGESFYSASFCRDTIYVSKGKELIWFDSKSMKDGICRFIESKEIKRDIIHCAYTDGKQNMWVGDEKGNVYCRKFGHPDFIWKGNINESIRPTTNYPVYSFYADTSGILWTGAYVLGLLKAEHEQYPFKSYPEPGSEDKDIFVNSIYEDNDEKIWLGTFENGIIILDKATRTTSALHLPYKGPRLPYGNSVPLIQQDSKGNLWTSKSGYLFVREKGTKHFIPIKMPPPSNALQVPQMWSFCEYGNGWVAGTTVGLYFLTKKNNSYTINHLGEFGQNRVVGLWPSVDQELWIAFESGGLLKVKNLEKFTTPANLFPKANVRSFFHDKNHQLLWMASSDGVIAYHLPTSTYKIFTEKNGLINDYSFGILMSKDELWVSTNYGLSKGTVSFSRHAAFPAVQFTNFTDADGLLNNVFNARAYYKGQSGNFYFGTPKGISWFKPGEITFRKRPGAIRMIELLVNDKRVDSLLAPEYITTLSMPYHENNLFFRFRAIDFHNPGKINYAYMLQGWDKDWIYGKKLNEVRYSNLPHGRYAFKIKTENSDGTWTEDSYHVTVTIHPPFWKTWWFYLLVGLAVVYTAVMVIKSLAQRKLRRQLQDLEKQRAIEAERNRISKDMHDEIGSGLTQIALISELMQTQKKADEELKKDVGNISSSARKLVESMSEIVWALNPQNDTLENLLAYLREQTFAYFEPFDIHYSVRFPDEVPFVRLANEQRRNLFLVAKEALNNALKHSGADEIHFKMEFISNTIHFYINDNGKGVDESKIKIASNGLRNMRKRMADIGGTFNLCSNENGCLIHFSLQATPSKKEDTTTFFTSPKKQS